MMTCLAAGDKHKSSRNEPTTKKIAKNGLASNEQRIRDGDERLLGGT